MKGSKLINLQLILLLVLVACGKQDDYAEHVRSEDGMSRMVQVKGLHGGKILSKDGFQLEVCIFEHGVPPQFRVYGAFEGKSLDPKELTVIIKLKRLGVEPEEFNLAASDDYLTSNLEVKEPHSFDVVVFAEYKGIKYTWEYQSYEGRVKITDKMAELSSLITETATSQIISRNLNVKGKIAPSEHKLAHIIPRFAGVVREGRKHIGDKVEKGEVLAIIESNQSLQPFEVRSQISGTVINGHLIVGEYVPENQWVYIVADLSEVWVDFYVPVSDRELIAIGQSVSIESLDQKTKAAGKISYIAPYADEKTQSQLIRVVIPNEKLAFLPGMYVVGKIMIATKKVEVAVKKSALQTFRDWQVVFAKFGEEYEVRPIKLGASDDLYYEVLEGLNTGSEYVVENSYLIKADILKSGAAHDH